MCVKDTAGNRARFEQHEAEQDGISHNAPDRAEALRPAPIKEQMAKAAKEAGKENAARPTPAKGKEARDDR